MDSSKKTPKKKEDLAWRVLDNETIIISPDRVSAAAGKLYILNDTATRIWELIDGRNSAENILNQITKEYDITREKAKASLKIIFDVFYRLKLLKP